MSVEVFIYSHSKLGRAKSELEDDLDEILSGEGEVTGTGSGVGGWNLDVRYDRFDDSTIPRLIAFLQTWGVPSDTEIQIVGESKAIAVFK